MKRLATPALLLTLMIVSWSMWRHPRVSRESAPPGPTAEATLPASALPPTPAAEAKTPAVPTLSLARGVTPPPAAQPGIPSKPQGNVIEFRVIHGLAVAYGDILLGKPAEGAKIDRGFYDAPTPQLWGRPEIPYLISPDLPSPERVERALQYLKQHSPVSFIPYQGQRDAIVFEPGPDNCLSPLGRQGGLQPIKLAPGCGWLEIMHEIMHSLGFVHEQSRPDRDQHIEILWANIEDQYKSQFTQVPESFMEAERGSSFDYHSIMLYRADAFALRPGLMTMQPIGDGSIDPSQNGLSQGDIRRLSRLYDLYDPQ